jgi:hypothetical protein
VSVQTMPDATYAIAPHTQNAIYEFNA